MLGSVLFMAANYSLSSAPGQACASLQEGLEEEEKKEDRGQGKKEEC